MTDDDQLRRLLSDAVSDVEPEDRLEELRASVPPEPPGGADASTTAALVRRGGASSRAPP